MDAVTETMFRNTVRDLGTANVLLREALAAGMTPPSASRKVRAASENIVTTIATLEGLARRVAS